MTWYASKGKNNPLISSSHLIVRGEDNNQALFYIRKDRQKTETTLIFPSKPAPDINLRHLLSAARGNVTLVTVGFSDPAFDQFPFVPDKWLVLDENPKKSFKPTLWPEPHFSSSIIDKQLTVRRVPVFISDDVENATAINLSPASILIIDKAFFLPESSLVSRFKEALDILIIPPEESIKTYREALRPRFLIAPTTSCHTQKTAANVICTGKGFWETAFKTDIQNRLLKQD